METKKIEMLPFHNKELLPKSRVDRSLFVFMTVCIPFAFIWELFIVLPSYHASFSPIVLIHYISASFIIFNICGNLYMLKRIDASGKQKGLPAVLKPGWHYCYLCELNSPPRAYHCPRCEECILKRDHHCFFTGCCVGYHNQRYYLLAILYLWIGAFYGLLFQWEYCFEQLGGYRFASVLFLTAPHFALVIGYLSFYGFFVATFHVLILIIVLLTTYLLFQQLVCIYNGQTVHERNEGISTYNLGWRKNYIEVLGNFWYLVWLSPWITSLPRGDGLTFTTFDQLQEIKNI